MGTVLGLQKILFPFISCGNVSLLRIEICPPSIETKNRILTHKSIPKEFSEFPMNSQRTPKEFPKNSQRIPKEFAKNSQRVLIEFSKNSKKNPKTSQKILPYQQYFTRAYRTKSLSCLFESDLNFRDQNLKIQLSTSFDLNLNDLERPK